MITLLLSAKDAVEPKYGPGAVPTDRNGMVTFSESIAIPQSASEEDCYSLLMNWARGRFAKPYAIKSTILTENADKKSFGFHVEEKLIFKKTWIITDEATIIYNFTLNVKDGKCNFTISDISYRYEEGREGGGIYVSAEEWITDYSAFKDKDKTKFYKKVGKFRIKTIDMKDLIKKNITETISK